MVKEALSEAFSPVEILERRGVLAEKGMAAARDVLAKGGENIERALVKAGVIGESEIAAAYAAEMMVSLVTAESEPAKPNPQLSFLLNEKFCASNLVVPLAVQDETIELAITSPVQLLLLDQIQFLTEMKVRVVVAPISFVEKQIELLFKTTDDAGAPDNNFGETVEPDDEGLEGVLVLDEAPPPGEGGRIIRMVNQILDQALRTGASDIHLEPFEDSCKLRLRIDGVLHELPAISKKNFLMIISRFKILAKMDIAERRIPQDGAIALKSEDKRVDLRVNTVPTVYGEKMVMRILDKAWQIPLDLTRLGLERGSRRSTTSPRTIPHATRPCVSVTGPDR